QSAMSNAGFLLDRFRLIDWSPAEEGRAGRATADSRLHERQPGALVFRRVEKDNTVTLGVVLLVLETPTAGAHRIALRNAIKFVSDWSASDAPAAQANSTLKVVGPVFSGSVLSLGLELNQWEGAGTVHVVTGSAMADVNAAVMEGFAQK